MRLSNTSILTRKVSTQTSHRKDFYNGVVVTCTVCTKADEDMNCLLNGTACPKCAVGRRIAAY